MTATAAHLATRVLPDVPVRQWVLSVPREIRGLLAAKALVLSSVLRIGPASGGIEQERAPKVSQAPTSTSRDTAKPGAGAALLHGANFSPPRGSREKFRGRRSTSYIDWASLMKRSMGIDVLSCPKCEARMQPVAVITQREVIDKILVHLRLCVVTDDGRPQCWAAKGHEAGRDQSQRCAPSSMQFRQISIGFLHTCALREDGRVACWGWDGEGVCTPP